MDRDDGLKALRRRQSVGKARNSWTNAHRRIPLRVFAVPALVRCYASRFPFGINIGGRATASMVTVAAMMLPTPAMGKVYFRDDKFEISGHGPRISRKCTVALKPTMTLGGESAPRLVLVTAGRSILSFGVSDPRQYSGVVVVQSNERKPLVNIDTIEARKFRMADIARVLKSNRLFFVTAQQKMSGRFVSSRYERIDFDAVMAKVGTLCAFDAESLMADLSERIRSEKALTLPQTDLTHIRWALNKKYGGTASKPETRSALSSTERDYLKRYAADTGLLISRYLTARIARMLILEGKSIARESARFTFEVCNRSSYRAAIAASARTNADSEDMTVRGWWNVDANSCRELGRFLRSNFHAVARVSGKRKGWYGGDLRQCVESPGPFERKASAVVDCPSNGSVVGFYKFNVRTDSYTWTLNRSPSFDKGDFVSLRVCNRAAKDAGIATVARRNPGDGWLVEGWWRVKSGSCARIGRFAKGKLYTTAKVANRRKGWYGTDSFQCVEFPGPFERSGGPGAGCPSNGKIIGFHESVATGDEHTFSFDGAPSFGDHEFFDFEVCNKSRHRASVAVMGRATPDSSFVVRGWYRVSARSCKTIGRYARGQFYARASVYGNINRGWWKKDIKLCVNVRKSFRRENRGGYTCRRNERLVPFTKFMVKAPEFRWSLR